ncbi:MAG TPA: deoxyribose-phosphate aldolase [Tenericutes bacterium]|nr:deoxyribose-phosphate aldolase [Mycoplasmatota bacterium]
MSINKMIDHTNLTAYATEEDIKKLCEEAKQYGFSVVCVPLCYVEYAKELLKKTSVQVCTVVGFPLGNTTSAVKEFEAICAVELGADEIDMVINIGALKDKKYEYIKREIEEIRDSIGGRVLKVIIEECYLTEEEIIKMIEICNETFVNYVKTSTGYGTYGATTETVSLIKQKSGDLLEIKASGGIKSISQVYDLLESGATRIGTSSGVKIMEELNNENI